MLNKRRTASWAFWKGLVHGPIIDGRRVMHAPVESGQCGHGTSNSTWTKPKTVNVIVNEAGILPRLGMRANSMLIGAVMYASFARL
jgi:hypothetical protein